ncbi:hypothetical protein ACQJBY_015478 [Aegilops geniculata]
MTIFSSFVPAPRPSPRPAQPPSTFFQSRHRSTTPRPLPRRPPRAARAPRASFLSTLTTASHPPPPTFLSAAGHRRLHLCARPRQASTTEPLSSPRLAAVSRCRPASFFSAPNRLEVCDPDHIFTGHGPMDPVLDPSSSLPRATPRPPELPRTSSLLLVAFSGQCLICAIRGAPAPPHLMQLGRGPRAARSRPPCSSAAAPIFVQISLGHIAAVLLGHQCVAARCPVHRRSLLAVRWHEAPGRMRSAVLFALPRCSSPADVLTIQDQLHPLPPPAPCSPVRGGTQHAPQAPCIPKCVCKEHATHSQAHLSPSSHTLQALSSSPCCGRPSPASARSATRRSPDSSASSPATSV